MKNAINTIEKYIKLKKITKTQFCKVCKISYSTLNKILNNNNSIKFTALLKIARVLNIEIHQLFA